MAEDPTDALFGVLAVLQKLDVRYAVGGSVASSLHGEPRMSADADLIAELLPGQDVPFAARLAGEYYVDADAVRNAVSRHTSFNVIHLASGHKVDVFVAGENTLDRNQLDRRWSIDLPGAPSSMFVTAPEDVVLRKLWWFRRGGEVSERQWRDVLGVMKQQRGRLDLSYLRSTAIMAGIEDLLERAMEESSG